MVAESTLILAPIDQLGCLTAISGVTAAVCARVQPRKGPPEPVRMILLRSPGRRERHSWMAECSLSTGISSAPFSRTRGITTLPPQTNVSLLARAISLPASMAASVGARPTEPETATITRCAPSWQAARTSPSSPGGPASMPVPSSSERSRSAAALS